MKGQDLLLMLVLISIQKKEQNTLDDTNRAWPADWMDWDDEQQDTALLSKQAYLESLYTARGLEAISGISKSQVNQSLNRCADIGLVFKDWKTGHPRTNTTLLLNFILHGVKFVFHTKPTKVTRGISTAFAAPVLADKIMTSGDLVPVWPDPNGQTKGLAIEPIYKSVTTVIRKDPELYAMLALIDAIRIGQSREANKAAELLKKHFGINK